VVSAKLSEWFRTNSATPGSVDFVLLDPPRAGAESVVIKGILDLQPKQICYVSCDPATLARDLKKLMAGGYAVDSIAAFDLFPQTHHVETVVHLSIGRT
jgi:23S rRNA (uracil1939-C5)-methyltransferase